MWLLNTRNAKLCSFPKPESVPGGYAILSHCWDPPRQDGEQVLNSEQTFDEVQQLASIYASKGKNPRDYVSDKIREFCTLAQLQGYDWGWADMCCIDKKSSSELSEAINSMFRYYSLAGVCYAFLADVPGDSNLEKDDSKFCRSRWHTRGWTLQELIAPEKLVFLSAAWTPLGTKHDLAELLEKITYVPVGVLTSMKTELAKTSRASRLSWAARRKTTRPEDEAYCLLGILQVDMYTSYGEGRRAFYRLQEELLKRSTDPSLFVWGHQILSMEYISGFLAGTQRNHSDHSVDSFLLAPSPSTFEPQLVNHVEFKSDHPKVNSFRIFFFSPS